MCCSGNCFLDWSTPRPSASGSCDDREFLKRTEDGLAYRPASSTLRGRVEHDPLDPASDLGEEGAAVDEGPPGRHLPVRLDRCAPAPSRTESHSVDLVTGLLELCTDLAQVVHERSFAQHGLLLELAHAVLRPCVVLRRTRQREEVHHAVALAPLRHVVPDVLPAVVADEHQRRRATHAHQLVEQAHDARGVRRRPGVQAYGLRGGHLAHGLGLLYTWRRRLRHKRSRPGLVEVSTIEAAATCEALTLRIGSEYAIEVRGGLDGETLRRVLEVLAGC